MELEAHFYKTNITQLEAHLTKQLKLGCIHIRFQLHKVPLSADYSRRRPCSHLICHDHELSIAQTLQGIWVTVVLPVLQTQDLDDVVDLSVLHNLERGSQVNKTWLDPGAKALQALDYEQKSINRITSIIKTVK